jgi:adenylate cyclase
LTKQLHASILLDEKTAAALPLVLPDNTGLLRRAAVVRPYGLEQSLAVSELLPSTSRTLESDRQRVAGYEQGLDAFLDGDWQRALELLDQLPSTDRVKDFITGYIVQHGRIPPADWSGVISMLSK